MLRLSALLLLLLTFPFAGCGVDPGVAGSGKPISEVRDVGIFKQIEVAGGGKLQIVVGGPEQRLEVECDDNLMEFLKTEVSNERLKVYFDRSVRNTRLNINLAAEHLNHISVAGRFDVVFEGLDEPSMEFDVAGSAKVIGSGKAATTNISIGGSGDFQLDNLISENVTVSIAGSGSVTVHATQRLDVSIAGSGKVRYAGDPEVKQSIAGSGVIEKAE